MMMIIVIVTAMMTMVMTDVMTMCNYNDDDDNVDGHMIMMVI